MTRNYGKALVLLGNHGAGKDTVANALMSRYKGFENIKFGSLCKKIVAEAFDIDPAVTEHRVNRTISGIMTTFGIFGNSLCALDMLNVLFEGSKGNSQAAVNFREASIQYAMHRANLALVPIFTDVRREQEMEAVVAAYRPTVIHLLSDKAPLTHGDEAVASVAQTFGATPFRTSPQPVRQTVEQIIAFLEQQP
jgi:hypothetical protein